MVCRKNGEQVCQRFVFTNLHCVFMPVCCVFVPGMEQRGARAGRTYEVDGQVSPPVVGQSEPGLDVL